MSYQINIIVKFGLMSLLVIAFSANTYVAQATEDGTMQNANTMRVDGCWGDISSNLLEEIVTEKPFDSGYNNVYYKVLVEENICNLADYVAEHEENLEVVDRLREGLCEVGGIFFPVVEGVCEAISWYQILTLSPVTLSEKFAEMIPICESNNSGVVYTMEFEGEEEIASGIITFELTDVTFEGCQKIPYLYQNVFTRDGRCKTYRHELYHSTERSTTFERIRNDRPVGVDNGDLIRGRELHNCQTSIPSLSRLTADFGYDPTFDSINVQQYMNWFQVYPQTAPSLTSQSEGEFSGLLWEALWINDNAYMRSTELTQDELIELDEDPTGQITAVRIRTIPQSEWTADTYLGYRNENFQTNDPSLPSSDPAKNVGQPLTTAQDGVYVLKRDGTYKFTQKVFSPNGYSGYPLGKCTVYSGLTPESQTPNDCANPAPSHCGLMWPTRNPLDAYTACPGGGDERDPNNIPSVSTYTAWVYSNRYYEALWREDIGYMRSRRINSDGSIVWQEEGENSENFYSWEVVSDSRLLSGDRPVGQGGYVFWEPYTSREERNRLKNAPQPSTAQLNAASFAVEQSDTPLHVEMVPSHVDVTPRHTLLNGHIVLTLLATTVVFGAQQMRKKFR